MLYEPLQRHDQAPVIPQGQHDIGAADLLDPAPLSFYDHHIVEPDWLGQCDLQSGQQIAQQRLGGKTAALGGGQFGDRQHGGVAPDGNVGLAALRFRGQQKVGEYLCTFFGFGVEGDGYKVRVANRAAGIVVGKFGTAVVTPQELFT